MQNNQKMDQEKPQVLTEAEINQVSGGRLRPIRPRPNGNYGPPVGWVSSLPPPVGSGFGGMYWTTQAFN